MDGPFSKISLSHLLIISSLVLSTSAVFIRASQYSFLFCEYICYHNYCFYGWFRDNRLMVFLYKTFTADGILYVLVDVTDIEPTI